MLMLPSIAFANVDSAVDEIVVTSSRSPTDQAAHIGSVTVLDRSTIEDGSHAHIHELMTHVQGVWIGRGSGQESLPSIRSPLLTGAGSCGAILTLEDGVPTRPNGFCNVNQLFELNTEMADRIEVIRGPGNAVYGSNALHGTINVLLPDPRVGSSVRSSVELGPNDFVKAQTSGNFGNKAPAVLGAVVTDDGGFRDDSGYQQVKGFAKKKWSLGRGELTIGLSASDLDQETAGFIFGKDAYKDPSLNRQNLNPEAFRDANSQRFVMSWVQPGDTVDLDIRPYARRSEMQFLQHFLPGQPLEENGHSSYGILTNARYESDNTTVVFGVDIDSADAYLLQTQDGPTEGSEFLNETRPEGKHYDYDVTSFGAAAYVQAEHRLTPRVSISGGLRAEYVHYDYRNNMLTGNTRDDGTPCGFGGCLYSRPASREDRFNDLAPKVGVLFRVQDETTLFVNVSRGFRAPQMTELYRLQSGQLVSDVDSEVIDSVEVGLRKSAVRWQVDTAVFGMRKKNSVYRDNAGFNVSGGRSRHYGAEIAAEFSLHDDWSLSFNGTWARHIYDFDVVAQRGETFVSGRDVDTAPRWQGSAEIRYTGSERFNAALQWVSLGEYFLDAENQHTYPGHDIANLRVTWLYNKRWSLTGRVNNMTDAAYADRADYAFGNYRYFPARGRELFLRLQYVWSE